MIETQPIVEIQGLSHAYKTHMAIQRMDFEILDKSIHGFVGPNGAGKTTTLKILATLLRPQRGTVKVFGMDVIRQCKEVRVRLGYMQDHFSMYRAMTVFEYLDFFGAAYGLSSAVRNKTIGDILELTDMAGRRNSLIKGLSRGMQQRVALARALVHDPRLLLLDEPASGLDPRARIELMEILRALRDMGKTIFISSHILSELAELCDHVTIVDRGAVKYTGTMQGLIGHNQSEGRVTWKLKSDVIDDSRTEALRQLPGIDLVEPDTALPGWRIDADPAKVSANDLLQFVLGKGIPVVAFEQHRRHLNEAFMDLTDPGVRS
jgi:ABC-2 type transport system ATP-binding protein